MSYLAFIAKNAKVRRFIYASSCSIYGYTINELYDDHATAQGNWVIAYRLFEFLNELKIEGLKDQTPSG